MANKFEMGSEEYQITPKVEKHYSEKEFEEKREMYAANAYDSEDQIDYEVTAENPAEYDSSKVKANKKAGKKILEFQKRNYEKELKAAKSKNIGNKVGFLSSILKRTA